MTIIFLTKTYTRVCSYYTLCLSISVSNGQFSSKNIIPRANTSTLLSYSFLSSCSGAMYNRVPARLLLDLGCLSPVQRQTVNLDSCTAGQCTLQLDYSQLYLIGLWWSSLQQGQSPQPSHFCPHERRRYSMVSGLDESSPSHGCIGRLLGSTCRSGSIVYIRTGLQRAGSRAPDHRHTCMQTHHLSTWLKWLKTTFLSLFSTFSLSHSFSVSLSQSSIWMKRQVGLSE